MKKSKILRIFLRLTWKLKPSIFFWLIFGTIITTGNTIFTVAIPKLLLDKYTSGIEKKEFFFYIGVICGIKLVLSILDKAISILQEQQKLMLTEDFMLEFSNKVSKIDYCNLEDPNVLDLKERAQFAVANFGALSRLFSNIIMFLSGIITLITVTTIMISFHIIFFIIILFLAIASLMLSQNQIKTMNHTLKEIIPINRRYGYYFNTSITPENQKDFRIYQMSQMMSDTIGELNDKTVAWSTNLYKKEANTNSYQTVLNYIIKFITYGYAAARTFTTTFGKKISLGDFTYYIGISEQFTTSFLRTIEEYFSIIQTLDMLEPMAQFMEIPISASQKGTKKLKEFQILEFKDVVFSYPKSDKIILDRISFQIHKGERISIVGLNNAGKSTVVKLICRLFTPTSGEIKVNGINIEEYDYEDYLATIGIIFQDFKLFPFTIRENIDTDGIVNDETVIYDILDKVGLTEDIKKLPNGIDTYLNKTLHKDGTDMSGGQKQKIAIARSIIKRSNLVILDEPTAALDPIAESELYEDFNQLIHMKTAIFISHRMSSTVFCDKILLLQDGKVKAFDSHSNLMKGNNLYRDLFETQAKNYIA